MGLADLLWLFFVISAVQPAVKQWLLQVARARLIARIERLRGSRVILLVHRQETMSLLGFPIMRYIDVNDAEEVLRACELTDPEVPLDIVTARCARAGGAATTVGGVPARAAPARVAQAAAGLSVAVRRTGACR